MSARGAVAGGLLIVAMAAHVTTMLGGGVDDPNSDRRCIAHEQELGGCNPNAGKLNGRCVVMAGTGQPGVVWVPSSCSETRALPAAVGRAGQPEARPALAGCGLTDTAAVLATIRTLESGGRYDWPPNAGGASGAYQFIQGTWNATARRAGRSDLVGVTPGSARPADQDAIATAHVGEWLHLGVEAVPVGWYLPAALTETWRMDVVPAPEAGNRYTPRQYQRAWLDIFHRVSGGCES